MKASALFNGNGLRAQLLRGGAGSVFVRAANVCFGLGLAVVLARSLGPKGYGTYAYVFALISLLAIPAQFGLPTLVVRETAKSEADRQWSLMRGVWRWAGFGAVALSLLLALVGGCLAWAFADHFSALQIATFLWGLVLVPLLALGQLRSAALRGLRKVVQGQLPEQLIRPALLICFILVFGVFSRERIDAYEAMALHALAAAIAFGIGAWLLQRARPRQLASAPAPTYESRKWLASILPFGLIAGMQVVNTQVDIVILGIFRTAHDVGIYRVAAQGATFVALGLTAVSMVAAPHIARFYATRDMGRLQKLATGGARANLALGLPGAVAFFVFGGVILKVIFGAAYAEGYVALAILSCAQLVRAGSGPLGPLLNMTGYERDNVKIAAAAAGCNLILNIIMVPELGMTGAALATGISMIGRRGIMWWIVRWRLGVDGSALGLAVAPR
jgi:O-antigen/teichoic acid export membrane protein